MKFSTNTYASTRIEDDAEVGRFGDKVKRRFLVSRNAFLQDPPITTSPRLRVVSATSPVNRLSLITLTLLKDIEHGVFYLGL